MNALKAFFVAAFCLTAAVPSMKAADEPTYMRSSLYTFLIKSDEQNNRLQEQIDNAADNEYLAAVKSVANTDAKRAANEDNSIRKVEIPGVKFLDIPIPNQFNDHNLTLRVLEYDPIKATITPEEKEKYAEKKSNGAKFGGFAKAALGAATGAGQNSTLLGSDDMEEYLPAVIARYIETEHVAPYLVGKWFSYNPANDKKWSEDLVLERGLQNASAEDLAKAKESNLLRSTLAGKGFQLIDNTYVLAINLRFRSNKAVVAESQALAGGILGNSAAGLLGAAAGAAAGEGFQVQAVTYLYKLVWTPEIEVNFAENYFDKNASIEDLIASGICKLEYIGKDKASAHVRQSILNTTPESELIARATARAIDAAIIKLQSKYEQFRTVAPIMRCDADGTIYAGIGLKEGLCKGDKYEVLEASEDPKTGAITYKAVATVEPDEKRIWDNRYGAAEEAAEKGGDEVDADASNADAVNLGASAFKGKKGKDFTGYFLRLKKKK